MTPSRHHKMAAPHHHKMATTNLELQVIAPAQHHKRISLQHPNITELFEVIATPDVLYLVMEHVREGDLREHLESHGPLSERQARAAFRQVVSALQYCHRRGIAHRDLKPDNILLDEDGTVKLADFGFGRRVSDDSKLSTFCGTFYYMAPEVLRQEPYDGRKADVWSLGVTLYRTVTGTVPFQGQSLAKIKRQVLAGQFEAPPRMSREGKQLLRWLLTVDPSQRPTLDEVMQHPWLNRGQEELRPYSEPPGGDLDPQVLEMMQMLGFEPDQVEQSVGERKYDREMGTYLILRMMETKMPGRKVKVRPYRSPDSSDISSSYEAAQPSDGGTEEGSQPSDGGTEEGSQPSDGGAEEGSQPSDGETEEGSQPSDGETEEGSQPSDGGTEEGSQPSDGGTEEGSQPSDGGTEEGSQPSDGGAEEGSQPSDGGAEQSSILPHYLCFNVTGPPPSLESMTTPPPLESVEFGTAPPSPDLQLGPGGSPATHSRCLHSSSSSIRGAAPEGAAPESCRQAGQPEGSTPASSSAHSQGRPGLARRAFRAFLKFTCCGLPTRKRRSKRNKVHPM
ncbi:hypothetical protein QTO34_006570 [Cnephaeus nilssonii]|uniref:non-specific serine/threonine protein kinase n=1 Tax=Cnephaeus nilssonii TaxID=3371016 RepID=A0AA40HKR9_CNENI|nr:hypothetical protein QTO34_006570 [Eptesicus nilssonii]